MRFITKEFCRFSIPFVRPSLKKTERFQYGDELPCYQALVPEPFLTGLLKCPYSFLLGQDKGIKCANPPPHRAKQSPKCTNPHLSGKALQKNELKLHPLGQGKEAQTKLNK